MALHVALLRGVNVGGHQLVAMADLRTLLAKLGVGCVRSLLQSGNLVFEGGGRTTAQWESLMEKEVNKKLGLTTTCFVRTEREWKSVLADNPFPAAASQDPSHLVVLFLKQAPSAPSVQALRAAIGGGEKAQAAGRQLYLHYADGIGRSRLTPGIIDAKLGQRGTGRNWNTVRRLGAMLGA
jgi:uncharacterized protein (DUF1697 family)